MRLRRRSYWLFLYALIIACGDDAAFDAGSDARIEVDGGLDAASDSGVDAARDSGADSSPADSSLDSGLDTGAACGVGGMPGRCLDVGECLGTSTPGFCPGPANIQCCTEGVPDGGMLACDPAAMPQPNLGLVEPPGLAGCPSGMVPITDFCIDRYEASLVDDATLEPWSPYFNPGDALVRAVSLPGAVPQGYINGDQAGAACARAGKRLCSDTEWLRACQGSAGSTFPYGDTRDDGVCNDARGVHPAVEYFMSAEPWVFSMIDHPCLNQLEDGLALTGDHASCQSEDGPFDMMGNLHEWTADPTGTFRGGFYVDTVINGPGCLYRTTAHDTLHWDYSTGFRCCADM